MFKKTILFRIAVRNTLNTGRRNEPPRHGGTESRSADFPVRSNGRISEWIDLRGSSGRIVDGCGLESPRSGTARSVLQARSVSGWQGRYQWWYPQYSVLAPKTRATPRPFGWLKDKARFDRVAFNVLYSSPLVFRISDIVIARAMGGWAVRFTRQEHGF